MVADIGAPWDDGKQLFCLNCEILHNVVWIGNMHYDLHNWPVPLAYDVGCNPKKSPTCNHFNNERLHEGSFTHQ